MSLWTWLGDCNSKRVRLCRIISTRLRRLTVAGTASEATADARFYTDEFALGNSLEAQGFTGITTTPTSRSRRGPRRARCSIAS